jgi:hypothetical protein
VRFKATEKMCADCPFGASESQRHMRRSLKPGRFNEIAQSVWMGAYFPCHKTTTFSDEGEGEDLIDRHKERECIGAIEFVQRASRGRETGAWREETQGKREGR